MTNSHMYIKEISYRFYQSECGDAALIHFLGNDNNWHNMFIDSGYQRTYSYILSAEIQRINSRNEKIDLWVITHIHDDHIGGVLSYIKSIHKQRSTDIVTRWLYNAPRKLTSSTSNFSTNNVSQATSILQGDDLLRYLMHVGKEPIIDITTDTEDIDLFGLTITLLSPDLIELKRLRDKHGQNPSSNIREEEEISTPKTVRQHDYSVPLDRFDISLSSWSEDESVENGSSIAFVVDFKGSKSLWLADAIPHTIIQSLNRLGYTHDNQIECDFVKVSHHGSIANNNGVMYNMIKSSNYIISANGYNKHALPNKACIATIIRSNKTDLPYNFYFTYDNQLLRSMFASDSNSVFDTFRFTAIYNSAKWFDIT